MVRLNPDLRKFWESNSLPQAEVAYKGGNSWFAARLLKP
jgi:hypothetical protein